MDAALNLGARSLGLAAPNPSVGAILVKDGAGRRARRDSPGRQTARRAGRDRPGGRSRSRLDALRNPRTLFAFRVFAALRRLDRRIGRRAGSFRDRRSESARSGRGACAAARGRSFRDGRDEGRGGAARPSRPHPAGDGRAAGGHAEARRNRGRLRIRRDARSAPQDHRADRQPARPGHALDARGDHDRRRDRDRRRSGADCAPAWPWPEAAARHPRYALAVAAEIAPRGERARRSDARRSPVRSRRSPRSSALPISASPSSMSTSTLRATSTSGKRCGFSPRAG